MFLSLGQIPWCEFCFRRVGSQGCLLSSFLILFCIIWFKTVSLYYLGKMKTMEVAVYTRLGRSLVPLYVESQKVVVGSLRIDHKGHVLDFGRWSLERWRHHKTVVLWPLSGQPTACCEWIPGYLGSPPRRMVVKSQILQLGPCSSFSAVRWRILLLLWE